MEKNKIKELIRLDSERSKATLRGDTTKYISSVQKITKLIRTADRNEISVRRRETMKKYFDNFNMSEGYTRECVEYISIGKNTLTKEIVKKDGKINSIQWEHRIDTRNAPYPSFACIIGAASCSLTSKRFFPVLVSFLKNIFKIF